MNKKSTNCIHIHSIMYDRQLRIKASKSAKEKKRKKKKKVDQFPDQLSTCSYSAILCSNRYTTKQRNKSIINFLPLFFYRVYICIVYNDKDTVFTFTHVYIQYIHTHDTLNREWNLDRRVNSKCHEWGWVKKRYVYIVYVQLFVSAYKSDE